MEISKEDLDELLGCIDSLIDMMEPYYKQCGASNEASEILYKYKLKQPYTHKEAVGASCKICQKTFERSNKGKLLDSNQQDTALTNHLITFHQLTDHKERKKYKQQSKIVSVHYNSYQEYLDSH